MQSRPLGLMTFLAGLLLYASVVGIADISLGVFFETNDDVGSMMYAHGFGLGAEPSPVLLFSNVWLGRFVLLLGAPFDRWAYGLVILGVQIIATAAAAAALARMNGRPAITLLLVGIIGLRGLIAPQFTILAGSCAVASVLLFLAYSQRPHWFLPLSAACLLFFGALVRAEMVALVLLVAAPALLRWSLLRSPLAWAAVLGASCLYALALFDHMSILAGPEWQEFRELSLLRAAITDFGLGPRLVASVAAQEAGGLSVNDALLMMNWWFLDPVMTEPEALRSALSVLGNESWFFLDTNRLYYLSQDFLRFDMMAVSVLALVLALSARQDRRRWIIVLALTFVVAMLLTASGRVVISRVYFPLLALTACLGLASLSDRARDRLTVTCAGLMAGAVTLVALGQVALDRSRAAIPLTAAMAQLDEDRVHLVWAANLPFETLYSPLSSRQDMPKHPLFGIGTHQRSPLALAHFGGRVENLFAAYSSPAGLAYIASPEARTLLGTHCSERLDGQQVVVSEEALSSLFVGTYSCRPRSGM